MLIGYTFLKSLIVIIVFVKNQVKDSELSIFFETGSNLIQRFRKGVSKNLET